REFERSARIRFENRLLRRLTAVIPAEKEAALPGGLERQARLGTEDALRRGITRESDVARYVELMCRMAGGFGGNPLAKPMFNILNAYGEPAAARLDRLEAWLTAVANRTSEDDAE